MTRRRAHLAAAAAALAALLLAGCTANGGGSDTGGEPGLAPEPDIGVEAPADGGETADQGVVPQQPVDEDRDVITTGRLVMTVDDPTDSAQQVAELVDDAGGRIDSRSETPGTEAQQARATLVVRIPADEFDRVLAELRELGEVDSVQLDADDVTQQRQDLDARIEALETSVDRLLALLADADTTADLIAIESELSSRQAELDSLVAQRDWLADQVDFSTLTVELLSEGIAPEARPDDFWDGLVVGWEALVGFGSGLLVVAGVLLPWIGVLLVIAAIVVAIVVLATRGRRHPEPTPHGGTGAPPSGTPAPTPDDANRPA